MDAQNQNRVTVESLYRALAQGDSDNVARLLASDLEWWFHGPAHCQHMMRVLTGLSAQPEFGFEPRSIIAIDNDRVIAEGWDEGKTQAYWVHVWTLKDGLITQFREYFNTWLTVRDLRVHQHQSSWGVNETLWQSQLESPVGGGGGGSGRYVGRSMPGLVLAI